jgi:hypothetical protein
MRCNTVQRIATDCNAVQHVTTHYNALHHYDNTLEHVALRRSAAPQHAEALAHGLLRCVRVGAEAWRRVGAEAWRRIGAAAAD